MRFPTLYLLIALFLVLSLANVTATTQTINGIDVSEIQRNINWTKVNNSGYNFAFIRATLGDDNPPLLIDQNFIINIENAHNAGIIAGAYHFAYPRYGTNATSEARHFLNIARGYIKEGYLRPALDIEDDGALGLTNEQLSNWIHEWINAVEKETGVKPILYVTSYYAKNRLNNSLNTSDLWIAKWTYNPDLPPNNQDIGIWTDWDFWQYSNQGIVPGIQGNLQGYTDLDIFNGDMSRLQTFLITVSNPPTISSISQHQSDGTIIPEGGTIYKDIAAFKATITDPETDQVRLEIELRRPAEYNGKFLNESPPELISGYFPSGSTITITRYGLINDDYHWQYRAKDSKGYVSDWKEFQTPGNIDFTIAIPQCPLQTTQTEMLLSSSEELTTSAEEELREGWVGTPYCQDGNVYQNYRNLTYNNQGQTDVCCVPIDTPRLKETCSNSCSNGECLPPDPQCNSGICCDLSTGTFKPASTICYQFPESQTSCAFGNSCGSNVGIRYKVQHCSAFSAQCTGLIDWGPWLVKNYCSLTEVCSGTNEPLCQFNPNCNTENWNIPSATGKINNEWTAPNNAFSSDEQHTTAQGTYLEQDYYNFNFNIPQNSIINGIEIALEGHGESSGNDNIIAKIWSQSTNDALNIQQPPLGQWGAKNNGAGGWWILGDGSDALAKEGGPTDLWGVTWNQSDFSNNKFIMRIETFSNPDKVYVDQIKIKVYYTEIIDSDSDGFPNDIDNCPFISNPQQTDTDSDNIGDICDNCPSVSNPSQSDSNENGIGDACDITKATPWSSPSSTGRHTNEWINGSNAFLSDNIYVFRHGNPDYEFGQSYENFNFNIPENARITGIEVSAEGYTLSDIAAYFMELYNSHENTWFRTQNWRSPDNHGGVYWFALYRNESAQLIGNSSDLWETYWKPSDFSNENFSARILSSTSWAYNYLDNIKARIHYTEITDEDSDGYLPPEDCNDLVSSVNPNATEICDLIDNNCNGQIDDALLCSTIIDLSFEENSGAKTFDDVSYYNNNAICVGSSGNCPAAGNAGKSGKSVQFNSVSPADFLRINGSDISPSNSELDVAQFTISFWMKSGNTNAVARTLVVKQDIVNKLNDRNFIINLNTAGRPVLKFSTAAMANDCLAQTTSANTIDLRNGVWHHIVATYDGADCKLYVDNSLKVTDAVAGRAPEGIGDNIFLGAQRVKNSAGSTVTQNPYQGFIDEFKLFNKALNDSEIAELYNNP